MMVLTYALLLLSAIFSSSRLVVVGCYTSIFSFGGSLSDPGNTIGLCLKVYEEPDRFPSIICEYDRFPSCGLMPNGETFFHHPTGRCCDGRLIIDFIAEHYGLPLLPPYVGGEKANVGGGVNFAVCGAPVIDDAVHEQRGYHVRNISMRTQLNWFKNFLPSICNNASSCSEILRRSLIVFGPFGLNDYAIPLEARNLEDARSLLPLVVNAIASAIEELIGLGATNIMVPGMEPAGCLSATLTLLPGSSKEDYDPITGCLTLYNEFSETHNRMLLEELARIREQHPNVFVTYADYYNAAIDFYRYPEKYGFNETVRACCGGGGGLYNFDLAVECGYPPYHVCADPSSHVSWDGAHFTEAANRWISKGLLNGRYTIPSINNASCASADGNNLYTY